MIRKHTSAMFLIAACALSTAAEAAKVYKCGSSYSQVPCADAVEIATPPGPSPQQQRAAEKEVQQQEKAAKAMEKERLNAEKAALKASKDSEKAHKPAAKAEDKNASPGKKTSKKEPEFFTAKAPAAKASQPR